VTFTLFACFSRNGIFNIVGKINKELMVVCYWEFSSGSNVTDRVDKL